MGDEAIFESTGSLGTEPRQYGRLYRNEPSFTDDPDALAGGFAKLGRQAELLPLEVSRIVLRGVVSDEVMSAVSDSDLRDAVEVGLPLREFGHDGWLLSLARNTGGRDLIVAEHEMIETTRYHGPSKLSPLDRVERLLQKGPAIHTELQDNDLPTLQELWEPTFGWKAEEIAALAESLKEQRDQAPDERTLWFAGIWNNGLLVSAAMAQRLELPGSDGPVNLVESTEWCTRPGDEHMNKGYVTTALSVLNAQVLNDLRDASDSQPVIYAECNFQNRSDHVGNSVGFHIPPRHYARQILAQNVKIGDGLDHPTELRDFSFMYLPGQAQEDGGYYDRDQVDAIMEMVSEGVRA
jgi:hypothetical protein